MSVGTVVTKWRCRAMSRSSSCDIADVSAQTLPSLRSTSRDIAGDMKTNLRRHHPPSDPHRATSPATCKQPPGDIASPQNTHRATSLATWRQPSSDIACHEIHVAQYRQRHGGPWAWDPGPMGSGPWPRPIFLSSLFVGDESCGWGLVL